MAVPRYGRLLDHHPNSRARSNLNRIKQMKIGTVLRLLIVGCGLLLVLRFLGPTISYWVMGVGPDTNLDKVKVKWDQYKYVQIVTTPEELCSAVMIWARVEAYGSRASRVMLYPSEWDSVQHQKDISPALNATTRLLKKTAKEARIKLRPTESLNSNSGSPWIIPPYTKLLAFNLTEFSRVLVLDHAIEYRGNMDELYLLPRSKLSMPLMHEGEATTRSHSSRVFLVSPSKTNFQAVAEAVSNVRTESFDVEIVKRVFPSGIGRIPDKRYGFTTSELRREEHSEYHSGSSHWDPDEILKKVKMVHYSDFPLPKPWLKAPQELLNKQMPKCAKSEWFGASNCRSRELWFKFYTDYAMNRRAMCGSEFEVKNVIPNPSEESGNDEI